MTFDPDKPHACRNGCKAAITGRSHLGFAGHYINAAGALIQATWFTDGTSGERGSDFDLVNIEPERKPREVWGCYRRFDGGLLETTGFSYIAKGWPNKYDPMSVEVIRFVEAPDAD